MSLTGVTMSSLEIFEVTVNLSRQELRTQAWTRRRSSFLLPS